MATDKDGRWITVNGKHIQIGGEAGSSDLSKIGIKVPDHSTIFYQNPFFELQPGERLYAHYTKAKNLKGIEENGLRSGTGKSGGVGSAGSTDLWLWQSPQKVVDNVKSSGQGVVLFAARPEDITKTDGDAAFIKNGSIPKSRIAAILKTK